MILQKRLTQPLIFYVVLLQASAVRNEMALLVHTMEKDDSCWENRLRCGKQKNCTNMILLTCYQGILVVKIVSKIVESTYPEVSEEFVFCFCL